MAFPTDIWRIQYTFNLGSDGEVAVTGFHARFNPGDLDLEESAAALAGRAAGAWKAGFDARVGDFPSSVVLANTAAYHVLEAAGPTDAFSTGPVSGGDSWAGTAADSLPWETTLVMTTECIPVGTFQPQARRKRGRMYLPPMSPTVLAGTEGFILNTKLPQLLTASLAWLEAWNDEVLGTQTRAVVLSRTGAMATDIDHLSCDYQVDLQKRRQNRQAIPARITSDPLDA